jgi:trigger factor
MQTTLEKTDTHTVRLTVEVPADQVGKDLDRAYRKVAKQVKIPGFRQGKVPRKVIDAQIGPDAVLNEFVEDSVPGYYRDAIREHELAPISDPEIDLEQVEEGKSLIFTAVVEVRPRLTLEPEEYRGLKVSKPSTEATDEEVDQLVDSLRERFAELRTVGRAARTGDYAVIDLRGELLGQEVPEATRPDFLYEVGAGEFTGALDRELEGTKTGDIVTFDAELDQRFGERAGQQLSFRVLVKEVKEKELPAADDEFAKTASEFDTLEELRENLRETISTNKERSAEAVVRDRVLQALVDKVDVDLPESLVEGETEHRVRHAEERAQGAGLTLPQLLELQGFDEERFRADARDHSVRAIRSDLALEAVARQEGLEVTAEEIGMEIAQLAAALGREPKEVATSLDRSGQVVTLAGDIVRTKALDVLVEHAEITPEDGSEASPSEQPENEPAAEASPEPVQSNEPGASEEGS